MDKRTCKLDGCERPGLASGGWCYAHWNRVRRNGEPGSPVVKDRRVGCLVAGCDAKHFGRGYCQTHHYRLATNGDPLVIRKVGEEPGPSHSGWRGNDIGYSGAHRRVARHRGKAVNYQCVRCNGPAQEWAYNHAAQDELIDATTGKPYSGNVDDYDPMCASCHRYFDAENGLVDEWIAADA